jgi:hypothetical protein
MRGLAATMVLSLWGLVVSGSAQIPTETFLTWSRNDATKIGAAMRRRDSVGNRFTVRGLRTERAISYDMRATWLTPDVMRATARLLQLNERLTPERAVALVKEAEAAGDAVFLVELDPNEGSGVIPNEWTALLQPKGLPRGETGGATGRIVPALRDVRALAGVFRRDYTFDVFWVVFPLQSDAGRPLFDAATTDAELVVNIQGQEAVVSWPMPEYVRSRMP